MKANLSNQTNAKINSIDFNSIFLKKKIIYLRPQSEPIMSIVEIIITIVAIVVAGGGALIAYNKKTTQKNIHIGGNGKVVGGNDNSKTINQSEDKKSAAQ